MTLKTRKPTGAVPWPLVLIEGEEKSGKSWSCAEFTASPRIGRAFWIDLGQGSGDEYGAIPGADFEIVEYDGSFSGLYQAVKDIGLIAREALGGGGKPVVLIIDDMTAEWDLLKDWATDRARSSRSNRAKLERDPNAEITVSGNYWNDANGRHRNLMRLLKAFPGIVLMVASGKLVAVIGPDGQPVEGKKTHKVEAQKGLGADASCWLRLYREEPGVIVGGRSVHLKFRPGDKPRTLAADWTLEGVIFDALKCDPSSAQVRAVTEPKADAVTPEQIRDEALHPRTDYKRTRELYSEAKHLGYDEVTLMNGTGDEELLLVMLARLGKERKASEAGMTAADAAGAALADGLVPPDLRDPSGEQVREARQALAGPADDAAMVTGFMTRITDAAGDDKALAELQKEIGKAKLAGDITPGIYSELIGLVKHARVDLAKAPAGAR